MPLLQVESLHKRYGEPGDPLGQVVLDGIDLSVEAGQSLAMVGPSGSGKSTLLNIIGTLDSPTSGRVLLDAVDPATLDAKGVAALRNAKIGFVFQLHHLLPQCTTLENVLVPTLVAEDGTSREKRAKELLGEVGLGDYIDRFPGQLSGGQRQRVAIARALVNDPKLVLADEPTGSLDRHTAEEVGDLLIKLNEQRGVTLIVATHAGELARRMQRGYEIIEGRLQPHEAKAAAGA